ncbi:MAG: pilus assembly protein [Gammaproteobacteria bacterium]
MNVKLTRKTALAALSLTGLVASVSWLVYAAALFDPEAAPVGYVGQPAVTSNLVASGNERLYAIDYSSLDWSGNLHAYALSTTGAIDDNDLWDGGAAHQLDLQTQDGGWDTNRIVVTRSGGSSVPFRWASLSAADKTVLGVEAVLNYVRGDRSNENPNGLKYRKRSTVLGDIIHSTPVYCDASRCAAPTVFVGGNDGMLHAFDANDGDERFAYIPSMLMSKLPKLKDDPYVHTLFVDGRLAVRKFGSQTILAGALGGGGRGLFALDVTNAAPANEAAAASMILWEITHASAGFANLGYVYGQPALTTLPSGTNALIVGNGYNNTGTGTAVLYVINAATGALIAAIDTGSGSPSSPNGLSAPTLVDVDVDGKADYAYAGDIDGNLWKFNLSANTATLLHTTSPAQAITMAPGVRAHPNGGFMVTFATGRIFTADDKEDTSTHYAYGIWDGAPASNTTLLAQVLTEDLYEGTTPAIRVRIATNATPNWAPGGHKGWRTALPVGGERVVGDGAYVTGSVFLFLSTNPTVDPTATPPGENWWMQLNALTGGDNGAIRFDLNGDNVFSSDDQLDAGQKPVGRHMGGGVRSQLTALSAAGFDVYHANYDRNGEPPPVPEEGDGPGVSGGHFDYDIYYHTGTTTTYTPTATKQTKTFCAKESDLSADYSVNTGALATKTCTTKNGFSAGYQYMTAYVDKGKGSCKSSESTFEVTCNTYTTATGPGIYGKQLHVHEYDDKYDVTGVNMLNASDPGFNLSPNVIASSTATTPEFKILVMNQFLNPASKLSVGGAPYVEVKNYNNLASETNAATLLAGLPVYSRATINTLVWNLPLDAFKSKDWWGAGGDGVARAGLIPTQTGCVNNVTATGAMLNSGTKGLPGPNGERFNGALGIQIIRADTPASALELNHNGGDVRYGWRVKQSEFTKYVIAEYSAFWHHPNGKCYGQVGWVPNAPEDFESDATPLTPAPGSDDPKDGVFGVIGSGGTSGGGSGGTSGTGGSSGTGGDSGGDGVSTGIVTGGAVSADGTIFTGGVTTPPEALGRVNWRELRQ